MIKITQPIIDQEEIDAVVAVMKSGMIAQGPETAKLEQKFAEYCGVKYAVAFNSGTAAIHAGLYALGLKEGDEVITTPFTFVATANPILMLCGKVIFADISEKDFNIDTVEIEKKITPRTKAIIPVDLYGQLCDYDKLEKIAKKYDLKILEDACQAVGAENNGVKAGTFGDVAAFSLYATKNIMCGEGGLITTNSDVIAEKCKMFRHHGQSEAKRYEYLDLGYNYRLTDICAAIGVKQLAKADTFNQKRIENAKKLAEGLMGIEGIILPKTKEGSKHVFHQFTIRITEEFGATREDLQNFLSAQGIGTGIYYPKPLHMHEHFKRLGYNEGDFPVAEKMAQEVLSLPVHPSLTDLELTIIITAIKEFSKIKRNNKEKNNLESLDVLATNHV